MFLKNYFIKIKISIKINKAYLINMERIILLKYLKIQLEIDLKVILDY